MYNLIFEPNTQGKERYEICYQAVVLTNKDVTNDNEDDFIELLKKLKKAGTVALDEKGKEVKLGGIPLRDLVEGGTTVPLERSEHKLLLDCIKRPIWRPIILEQKKECEKWIEAIKREPGSAAVDAKPEEKRRLALAEEDGN